MHENFARALAASLSAYLRAYVGVNLISLEQITFKEFSQSLASPAVLMVLEMAPYEGHALLEISPGLAFPILEIAMGGGGRSLKIPEREVTEIEANILKGVARVMLNDLKEAWRMITDIDFRLVRHETEPQLIQLLAPNDAVVAARLETRIGEQMSTINIAVPSLIIKMLRQKFTERGSVRHGGTPEEERQMLDRLLPALLKLEGSLDAGTIRVEDLLRLAPGEVLAFDYPIDRPLQLKVNGLVKQSVSVVEVRGKRCLRVEASA